MYILAFKDGHDPAACLLKDGEIIAAVEEERFIRKKHAPYVFPTRSIRYCLEYAGIREEEINYVAYARLKPLQTFLKVFSYYCLHIPRKRIEWRYFISHMKMQVIGAFLGLIRRAKYNQIRILFPGLPKRIFAFEHHLCHTASAYYFSGFSESLIITMDGKGEATSVLISQGCKDKIKILERRGLFHSFGMFYSSATKFLGFTPNDGEYKVMGLAPYGKPTISFEDILSPDENNGYRINSDFVLYPFSLMNFEKKFGKPRDKGGKVTKYHKDFAASVQKALEDSGLSLTKYALQKTKTRNLCLAGGVALNVKMNKKIWESGMIDNIFIQPAAGDDGLVLGAAALLYNRITGKRVRTSKNLYLASEYSNSEIKKTLDDHKLNYHFFDNPVNPTVELLVSGKVVGWFQGRMEFGPRALGNRSILAHPGIKEMKDLVNKKIKFREGFRPFCPSILDYFTGQYFNKYVDSPYMIMSFDTNGPEIDRKIRAVVHVDGTVRPQSVCHDDNPLYYSLIEHFHKKTGIPALLNTSMNIRGEPIVCSPEDMVNFFLKTNVDAIVAGGFLMIKKEQDKGLLIHLDESQIQD